MNCVDTEFGLIIKGQYLPELAVYLIMCDRLFLANSRRPAHVKISKAIYVALNAISKSTRKGIDRGFQSSVHRL